MANEVVPTRQGITANMYALRAGLSVVSEEVCKAESARDTANTKLSFLKESVKSNLAQCRQTIKNTEDSIKQQSALLEEKKKEQKAPYSSAPMRSFFLTFLASAFMLFTFGVVIYMICSWIFFSQASEDPVLDFWFGWYIKATGFDVIILLVLSVLSLAAAGVGIFLTKITSSRFRKNVQYNLKIKEKRKIAREMVQTIPQNIAALKQDLLNQQAALVAEQNKSDSILAEATVAYKKVIAQIMETHVQPAKAVYQSLIQIYSGQIDERDWANLDYLIYAVETGRADTIKESLQLLDREKQTDRIVAAIQAASREIAQILNRGFSALGEQMAKSFIVLSKQIQASTETILGRIGEMQRIQESQNALLSARVSQLTQQQSLNNALLEKANESSEQLVADAHRIVELENMRYNRGY